MLSVSATTPWPGERGVAVHEDRQHRERLGVVDRVLLGADHADDDRVDRLEVARVGGQLDRDVLAGAGHELAALAEVVLHVARALHRVGVDLALELLEDLVVALADDVREHVEAAAVGHADDRAVELGVGGRLEDGVEDRDGRLGALEPEPLLADVLRGEELLERLGRVEPLEDVALVVEVGSSGDTPSTCSWIQRCSSGSWMCMYSMPIVRQYASRSTWRMSPRAMRSRPARPPVRNSRSRSQMVSP